jgi:hypothetical protein
MYFVENPIIKLKNYKIKIKKIQIKNEFYKKIKLNKNS